MVNGLGLLISRTWVGEGMGPWMKVPDALRELAIVNNACKGLHDEWRHLERNEGIVG